MNTMNKLHVLVTKYQRIAAFFRPGSDTRYLMDHALTRLQDALTIVQERLDQGAALTDNDIFAPIDLLVDDLGSVAEQQMDDTLRDFVKTISKILKKYSRKHKKIYDAIDEGDAVLEEMEEEDAIMEEMEEDALRKAIRR